MSAVTAACRVLLLAGMCACLWARPAQLPSPAVTRRPEIARVGKWSDGAPSPYSRKLLQESPSGATQQPPENVTVINYNAPATGVVVGSVVGGLGGLTLVLAGALLIASGAINRWGWCSWLWRLGGQLGPKGKGGQPQSPSTRSTSPRTTRRAHSFSTLAIPSTKTLPSILDTAPRSISETYGLLRAERAADAPTAYATYTTTGPRTSPATQGGVEDLEGPNSPLRMLSADLGWRDCLIDPSKVQILRRANGQPWRLGGGSFGQVYKALFDDVQVVAVKVLPGLSDPRQLQAFLREGQILRGCRDKNIVQFVGVALDPESDQAMLVTEFMDAGDLWRALHWRDQQGRRVFGWHQRGKKAALDAARGLHYLHQHHIIHFDLKSANILLDRSGTAKLADVGLAKVSTKNYFSAVKTMGTFAWTAPEVLTGQRCDEKADIFSWGVVLWEVITGETPTRGTMRAIEVPEECPPEIHDLCDKCMSADPRDRPSAKQIVRVLEVAVGGVGRQQTIKGTPHWLTSPKASSGPSGPQDWPAPGRSSSAEAQLEGAASAIMEPETPFAAHGDAAKPGSPGSPEPEPSLDGTAALSRRSPGRSPFGTPVHMGAGAEAGGEGGAAGGQEVQLVQLAQPPAMAGQAALEGVATGEPSPGQPARAAAAAGPGSSGVAAATRLSSPFETGASPFEGGSTATDAASAAAAPAATPPWMQWRQGSNAAMLSPFAAFGGGSFDTRTSSEEEGGLPAAAAAGGGAEEQAAEQAEQKTKPAAVPAKKERPRKSSSVRFSLPPHTPSTSSGVLLPQRSSAAPAAGQAAPSQQDQSLPPRPPSLVMPPPLPPQQQQLPPRQQ